MEWKDLRPEVKSTLELCWGLYDDNPRSITRTIGEEFEVRVPIGYPALRYAFTEESYQQTLEFQKSDPCFDIKREGNLVTYTGRGKLASRE